MSAAPSRTFPELAKLELGRGVCGIKIFAGSSTGDLLVEDDEHLERVMRSGRRRIAYHSEDEYRLQERRPLFKSGDPVPPAHGMARRGDCAFLGTRRLMALARATGRPAHILHVSTAEELDYLKDFRDLATCEVLVNHLTQVAPDCYDTLKGFGVMNPPIRGPRHLEAAWRAINDGTVDTVGSDHAPHARDKKLLPWPDCPAGLTGVQTIVPVMLNHVNAGPAVADSHGRSDVRGAGAGLWRCRQGPARGGLRRRFHPGGHAAPAAHRGIRGSSRPAAGRRSPAWTSPAGRSR